MSGLLTEWRYFKYLAVMLVVGEVCVNLAIMQKVRYTEIDWKAYMQEVEGYLGGERNYTNMRGDTGPLVYPAGFVYLFSFLHEVTSAGTNILAAQHIWVALYACTLAAVLFVHHRSKLTPPWAAILLCLSYRLHSIFVLRLFNDCWAVFLFYLALSFFLVDWWSLGCLLFSLAVSVKMNILLFAPGLLYLLLKRFGWKKTFFWFLPFCCALPQVLLGWPFLSTFPLEYINGAFEFRRVFMHRWTVNWKFLPEDLFVSKQWALALLACHLSALLLLAAFKWPNSAPQPATVAVVDKKKAKKTANLDGGHIVYVMMTSNFAGIAFSRSIHYQFYCWFFHSLPTLAWSSSKYFTLVKLMLLAVIEMMFLVYPAQPISSAFLIASFMILLFGIFISSPPSSSSTTTSKLIKKD